MADLLLELFSEEIPAAMQPKAETWLRESFSDSLKIAGLSYDEMVTFRTPRRLGVMVKNLPNEQSDKSEERKGPATNAPEKALSGFLSSTGLTKEKLEIKQVKGKDYYFATLTQKGQKTKVAIQTIIEELLPKLPWQKSMRWGDYDINWARPLQNICCILGADIVPVIFAHLTANNITYGHRFHAPEPITLTAASDYESTLKKAYVIANGTARESLIKQQLEQAAAKHTAELLVDPALLREVTGLVEWPVILTGDIDPNFMDLPPEVMRSEMRNHQKYFTLLKDGKAFNKFLITSNIEAIDGGKAVIAGNERVLRARLSDGQFFFHKDKKKSLEQWSQKLESVVFHAKLGTVADKIKRITALAEKISAYVQDADPKLCKRAALLCKADLATGMVGEFPELQGIMGRYYAIAQNEDAQVANAISEHYLPQGPNSPVPSDSVSIVVSLADKIDNLIELFRVDEAPTGSKDPFALRRAALGVIRIVLENEISLPLDTLILQSSLHAFMQDRLRSVLKDKGIRFDVIEAVMSNNTQSDMLTIAQKAKALQEFMKSNESELLIAGYKRASNIVLAAETKDNEIAANKYNAALFEDDSEKALQTAMNNVFALDANDLESQLSKMAQLRQPIDNFFDQVMVNHENQAIRNNRLQLLKSLTHHFNQIADFSKIQLSEEPTSKQAA